MSSKGTKWDDSCELVLRALPELVVHFEDTLEALAPKKKLG